MVRLSTVLDRLPGLEGGDFFPPASDIGPKCCEIDANLFDNCMIRLGSPRSVSIGTYSGQSGTIRQVEKVGKSEVLGSNQR